MTVNLKASAIASAVRKLVERVWYVVSSLRSDSMSQIYSLAPIAQMQRDMADPSEGSKSGSDEIEYILD